MFKQPAALTTHITLFGNTNVGKSTLFNRLLGQDRAIVSPHAGTTTDPVQKRFELIPYGPIILTDTAGLDDDSVLGSERVKKAQQVIAKTDFAVVLFDAVALYAVLSSGAVRDNAVVLAGAGASSNVASKNSAPTPAPPASNDVTSAHVTTKNSAPVHPTHSIEKQLQKAGTPYFKVATKVDLLAKHQQIELDRHYPGLLFISSENPEDIECLQAELVKQLGTQEDKPLVANLLEPASTIALVVPIDSEAPKGRIILPQVQVIRDCLDHGVNAFVTNEVNLPEVLKQNPIDLVITDSQAFHMVKHVVGSTPLTSFSIVLARSKGDLSTFVRGVRAVEGLTEKSHVLICESCSHNVGHEDIGEVKIPALLKKRLGKHLQITHKKGHDFPVADEIQQYDLIIHCGSCMLNSKVMQSRLVLCHEAGVPITNYGIYLAYENGILERAVEVFQHEL